MPDEVRLGWGACKPDPEPSLRTQQWLSRSMHHVEHHSMLSQRRSSHEVLLLLCDVCNHARRGLLGFWRLEA